MLTYAKIPGKLTNSLGHYLKLRFQSVAQIDSEYWQTREHFRQEPDVPKSEWKPAPVGMKWGGDWLTAWFRGDVTIPEQATGKRLWLHCNTQFHDPFYVEALAFIDGKAVGGLDPNHPFLLLSESAESGKKLHCAVEAYSLHSYPGTMPFQEPIVVEENCRTFFGMSLCIEHTDVTAMAFDLKTLLDAYETMDDHSLRRAQILTCLQEVFKVLPAMPFEVPEEEWRDGVAKAREIMRPIMETKNSASAPEMGVVAHTHIDTAWLWPIAETRRKFARSFSTMINLLDQFPEVIFFQSAPCHADFLRQDYPEIFERVKKKITDGRWEPNGAMWVEPDCNIPNGESLVRQCLVGIQWTREHYGYSPDTFWQPDVFGYSASLPQILQGCGVEFFCTTKMAWNDTTRFPFDTFNWTGIDGTSVTSHLASIPQWVDAKEVSKEWKWAQHKDGQNGRLLAYGYGDGGGGPRHEDMELMRRMSDFDGLPKTKNTTVSDYMKSVKAGAHALPNYVGELYLELHRGTLTTLAPIKKANRVGENALRKAEFALALSSLKSNPYPHEELLKIWKHFLMLQFHDILPGTSIQRAHEEAVDEFAQLLSETKALEKKGTESLRVESQTHISLFNSLSWDIDRFEIESDQPSRTPDGCVAQNYKALDGKNITFVEGCNVPALSAVPFEVGSPANHSVTEVFLLSGKTLETPFYRVRFSTQGFISSLYHKATSRHLVRPGSAFNTFLVGEDIPELWDNWDIDADQHLKLKESSELISREVIANGPLFFQIRSAYKIGRHSTLTQDMMFYANHERIDFRTHVDWKEKHMLLKADFDYNLLSSLARHEIQFGHVERATHRNYAHDRARFEVSQQKWTDISETNFGIALLNDCKYGIGIENSHITLSLLKSGTHPDPRGDEGQHTFNYAILPHQGPFNAERVVCPAFEFNIQPTLIEGAVEETQLLNISHPNVIVESVKWAEANDGFVVRLYEAEKSANLVKIKFGVPVSKIEKTNLLEEQGEELMLRDGEVELYVRPFEIITMKCTPA